MRKGLVVLVLLAAAVPVFGQGVPATLSLTTPGAALVGGEYQIQYADVAGGFDIQVMLDSTDATGMSSFGLVLVGDSGFVLDAPNIDAYPVLGNYNAANNWVNNYESGAGYWLDGPLPMGAPTGDYYAGTIYKGTVAVPPPPKTYWGLNGLALTMHISALPADPTQEYVIGVAPEGTYVGDSSFANAVPGDGTLSVIPLRILPEPVSALLLLAGLPLLRRRR